MSSRKARKRLRRWQQRSAASALHSQRANAGGWGPGCDISRSDLLLLRRAIREGWSVPSDVRDDILRALCAVLDDSESSGRLLGSTMWAVIEMEGANIRAESLGALSDAWPTQVPVGVLGK